MRRSSQRGMTLVELIMAVAILTVVVAIAMSVVVAGANLSRNADEQADSDEAARRAADVLSLHLHHAGMGAVTGFNAVVGGVTVTVGSVLGVNSTTGPDELWVVSPVADVLGTGCDGAGNAGRANAGAVVQDSRTDGVIRVRCVDTLPANGLFMVTNLTNAALINVTGYNPNALGTDLLYVESGQVGFTNNFRRGGFSAGDLVAPVAVRHFYVDPAPPRPRLMEARGALTNAGGFPFVDVAGTEREVVADVEDFQVTFGVDPSDGDDPSRIAWQHGFGGANGLWSPGLRSVNIAIVARSRLQYLSTSGTAGIRLGPMAVADHDPNNPVPVPDDGHRRVLIERRIELPNAAPWNL